LAKLTFLCLNQALFFYQCTCLVDGKELRNLFHSIKIKIEKQTMHTHTTQKEENKSPLLAHVSSQKSGGELGVSFNDNRLESVAQYQLQEMAHNSPSVQQTAQLQTMANSYTMQQLALVQKKENNTGLPDQLKSGIENLSGYSMDDVKVHYNSPKPAQLQAHAYAQGTNIHIASGQEKHLPHEAWHVVQQKQGRVKPTMQMKGKVNVNDDAGLEKEADVMGNKAVTQFVGLKPLKKTIDTNSNNQLVQKKVIVSGNDDEQNQRINKALSILKANSYGKVVFDVLDKLDKEIKIVHNDKPNGTESEVRVDTSKEGSLDQTILHEMIHTMHYNLTKMFPLEGIYKDMIQVWGAMTKTKIPNMNLQENDEHGFSLAGYFGMQEEELVTQEWEQKYSKEENQKDDKRSLRERAHYLNDGMNKPGAHTGKLSKSSQEFMEKIYGEKPEEIGRLNSYDDFISLLQEWITWLSTYVTDEFIPEEPKRLRIDLPKRTEEIKALIKEVIKDCNTMKSIQANVGN